MGKAIISYVNNNNIALLEATDFKVFAGNGVKTVVNGKNIVVAKPDYFLKTNISFSDYSDIKNKFFNIGATTIFIAIDDIPCGIIALADSVRPQSKEAIKLLKKINISPILLTGDNNACAKSIANEVDIDEIHSNLLPEDKMNIIKELTKDGKKVCMVGDGVNDALAISSAYAGVAMGGVGSDIAIESADAVLVKDDIRRLPYLFKISKKTMNKVTVNIVFFIIINLVAVVLSAMGFLTPITGALVHNAGSVLVVVNAALLLVVKDKNR